MDVPVHVPAFGRDQIRRVWHNADWYYSIVDVVRVLTNSKNAQAYWAKLKERLATEGGTGALADVVQLKLQAADRRFRLTDTANRQTLLRIIQSVPSPLAEPFKQWLAQVGEERIAELENPEAAIERVRQAYRARGHDDAWIEARIQNDLTRNELTDEWLARGAEEGRQFAILTSAISQGTFGISIQAHKDYKLLPARANLRDHMTSLELALISLGEATATILHRRRESEGFTELHRDARDAGAIGGRARRDVEATTGEAAVSPTNHLALAKPAKGSNAGKGRPTGSGQRAGNEQTPATTHDVPAPGAPSPDAPASEDQQLSLFDDVD